jgi:cell fate regulator YaaT (PSP1 superfamily)
MEEKININTIKEFDTSSRGCCVAKSPDNTEEINQLRCCKLSSFNWLKDYDDPVEKEELYVEVRFKNDHKEFFKHAPDLLLSEGDIVAVEAQSGHDIGIVSLAGDIVRLQMNRKHVDPQKNELKQVYRYARPIDITNWLKAISLENDAIYKSREAAANLGLEMKINDVEYQGDSTKAIFYYTANDRVDFRELIKKLAEIFSVRIEMRQIGVRQEAAKLGGIGSCGRELCCSSWMSDFKSVSTSAARIQQMTLNPQKLAGQCGKLKCCLNYEVDDYSDALKEFPDNKIALKSKKGEAFYKKSDVFKKIMWYAYKNDPNNLLAIHIDEVKKIIDLNKRNKLPEDLESFAVQKEQADNIENNDMDQLANFI